MAAAPQKLTDTRQDTQRTRTQVLASRNPTPSPDSPCDPRLTPPSPGFLVCQVGTTTPRFCTVMGISRDSMGDTASGTWLTSRPALSSKEEDGEASKGLECS